MRLTFIESEAMAFVELFLAIGLPGQKIDRISYLDMLARARDLHVRLRNKIDGCILGSHARRCECSENKYHHVSIGSKPCAQPYCDCRRLEEFMKGVRHASSSRGLFQKRIYVD